MTAEPSTRNLGMPCTIEFFAENGMRADPESERRARLEYHVVNSCEYLSLSWDREDEADKYLEYLSAKYDNAMVIRTELIARFEKIKEEK